MGPIFAASSSVGRAACVFGLDGSDALARTSRRPAHLQEHPTALNARALGSHAGRLQSAIARPRQLEPMSMQPHPER